MMKTELVTTLKREATRLIAEIRKAKTPLLITQHGRPAAYLVDAESFEAQQQRLQILEGIARGERAAQEGRVVTHREAKRRMGRWLA
jgi:prevent-host-death family protein